MAGPFQEIDIDGHTFQVIAAREFDTDDGVGLAVLLRLTPEQLAEFRRLFNTVFASRRVQVRRVGLDPAPGVALVGGFNYWSRHEEGDAAYYKQILRLLPVTEPAPSGASLAFSRDHEITADMLLALIERFEVLVDDLARTNTISDELRAKLVGEFEGSILSDAERLDGIYWRSRRAADAEEQL